MEPKRDVKLLLSDPSSHSPKQIACIFCKKLCENRMTVINDKKDILGALAVLGVKYEPIPGVLDQACYQCVYRINLLIDFRRLLERNINKTRANYYYSIGKRDLSMKYLAVPTNRFVQSTCSTNAHLDLLISDVRSESEPEPTADFLFDCFNDPDRYSSLYSRRRENQTNSPSRLLEPMYETSESVMCTESGGKMIVQNKYKNYNNLDDKQYKFKCQFCPKAYKRLYFLRKHERRHRVQMIRRSSTLNDTFTCEDCDDTFETRLGLKTHEKTHRNRVKCSFCPEEFCLQYDLELHEAECYGEMCARDDKVSKRSHNTRSQRKCTYREYEEDEEEEEEDDNDTLFDVRMQNVDDWVERVDENYNDDDGFSDCSDCSKHSFRSFISALSRVSCSTSYSVANFPVTNYCSPKKVKIRKHFRYVPSKRKRGRSRASSASVISKRTRASTHRMFAFKELNELISIQKRATIQKPKRYTKRAKLRRKNVTPIPHCLEKDCDFANISLLEVMEHDIDMHGKLANFYCVDCKRRFTRRQYLQSHENEQHMDGIRKCYLCLDEFYFQSELNFHLELHAIRSHSCPVCCRSYLKEIHLIQHMLEMEHFYKPVEKKEYFKLFDRSSDSEESTDLKYSEHITQQDLVYDRRKKFEEMKWNLADSDTKPPIIRSLIHLNFQEGNDDEAANATNPINFNMVESRWATNDRYTSGNHHSDSSDEVEDNSRVSTNENNRSNNSVTEDNVNRESDEDMPTNPDTEMKSIETGQGENLFCARSSSSSEL